MQAIQPAVKSTLASGLGAAQWYVLFVRSNQEKRVAYALQQRGIEHFLPCICSLRQWKDRRVRLEMPLFPGYVFIHLPLAERLSALTVPNVVSMVGKRNEPAAVSTEEIAWIRAGITHPGVEQHEYLQTGQRVRISSGALAGMEGILVRQGNGTRVVVSLDSIARAFAVEVEAEAIEMIGAPKKRPGWERVGPESPGLTPSA